MSSFLLSQFINLLRSSVSKSVANVGFWIGNSPGDLLAGVEVPPHPENIPDYYAFIESLVMEARIYIIAVTCWRRLTNKMLYAEKLRSFPLTRVEIESCLNLPSACRRVSSPVLSDTAREICFLIVHKLPVKERLFRISKTNDPYCLLCFTV